VAASELDTSALYGLPLAEFTKARDELAKRARAQNDPEQAARISRLKKPSLPAWVLNMLPRLRQNELQELLRAGEEAEHAQAAALAGSGDPRELQTATDTLRRRARTLAGEAGEILVKGGHAAREETLLRIATALRTSAVTAEGRRRLQEGAFAEEPQAAGFDLFTQLSAPAARKRAKAAPPRAEKPPVQAPDRRRQAEARRAARQAVDDARDALGQRRRERAEADAATREAERAARAKQREAEAAWKLVERNRQRAALAQAAELEAKQQLSDAESLLRARD
jgi:hypothetical protein